PRRADGRRTASLHEFEPEREDDDQDRQSGEVQNKDHQARSANYRIDALRRAHIRKRCMRWKSPPVLRRGGAMVSPQNGRGATIFAKICASVAPGRTCSAARRRRALALQLAGGARRWPLSAAFEPIGHLWHVTEVDPRRPRPGQDARDIEVSDREMLAEELGR